MNDEEPPRPRGLPESALAPMFDTKDIYGKEMNLENLLKESLQKTFNATNRKYIRI